MSTNPGCVACGYSTSIVFCAHDGRTVRRCSLCSLLFVSPQPDQDNLHRQFQSDYFIKGRPQGQTRLELEFEEWRQPTIGNIAAQILRLKDCGKLLDVGCASGELFERFRNGKWQLYGVEPSALAFKRAEERFGADASVHLFNDYLSNLDFADQSFDVITILESLYYMPDPRRELSQVARLLKVDGVLAIAIPGYAYQRLRHNALIRHFVNGEGCSLTASHLFYFSAASMGKLLATYGFRIFDVQQLGTSVYGNRWRRLTQTTYLRLAKVLAGLTWQRVTVAPHMLYLSSRTERS